MAKNNKKVKVAIIGSGNIGTDLLIKVLRSEVLDCSLFVGRSLSSRGISKAVSLGVNVSDLSIDAIIKNPKCADIIFDATSAMSHKYHAPILDKLGKMVIDLTPSGIGKLCVPAVNLPDSINYRNINVITCGGQASIPLAYVVSQILKRVEYIEVISAIASRSAGPATRANIDEYIETTEKAVKYFTKCDRAKVILILNPAQPCIDMQTTLFVKAENADMEQLKLGIEDMVRKIKSYVPGYQLVVSPTIENGRIAMIVKVKGLGDYLPSYAGNLDIINCAAIAIAEEYARVLIAQGQYA